MSWIYVLWSTDQSCVFLTPEYTVQVQRWSLITSISNFLQPQTVSDFSGMTGIWVPMVMVKKVCQRLPDQTSSLRWDLICPSQSHDELGTLLTGQQGTPTLCPDNRVFFFIFWREFFLKKNVFLSVSFSLVVHTLSVFCGLMYSTNIRCKLRVLLRAHQRAHRW